MPALDHYLAPQLAAGAPNLLAAFAAAGMPAKIQCLVTLTIMALLVVVIVDSVHRWFTVMAGQRTTVHERNSMPEAVGL